MNYFSSAATKLPPSSEAIRTATPSGRARSAHPLTRRNSFIAALLPILQVGLIVPALLFVSNASEFTGGLLSILRCELPWLLAFVAGIFCLILVAPVAIRELLGALFLALGVSVYLQSGLLVWDYGLFDGHEIPWGDFSRRGAIDLAVWGAIFVGGVLWRKRLLRAVPLIAAVIILLQLVAVVPLLVQRDIRFRSVASGQNLASTFQLSSEKNVIFILLDGFQSPAFQALLDEHPDYRETFRDFTYYRNTLASFPTTSPSIPAILTGQEYDNSKPLGEFLSSALPTALPVTLQQNGFSSAVVTLAHYCDHLPVEACAPVEFFQLADRDRADTKELYRLLDLTFFRVLPQIGKEYIFHNQEWFLQRLTQSQPGAAPHVNTIDFVNSFTDRVTVSAAKPTFRFYHLAVPHFPLGLDEHCEKQVGKGLGGVTKSNYLRQASCALLLASRMIERIRALNIYDSSMIVVLADHGSEPNFGHYKARPDFYHISRALPLLLIKRIGEHQTFQTSQAPARLADLPATVADALGIPAAFSGTSILQLSDATPRERHFRAYSWNSKFWKSMSIGDMQEYLVNGDAWKMSSWRKGESYPAPK